MGNRRYRLQVPFSSKARSRLCALLVCAGLIVGLGMPVAASGEQFAAGQPTGRAAGTVLYDGLAVGVPYEDIGNIADAGGVNVIPGSANGLTVTGNQGWDQDRADMADAAEPEDLFGYALAGGDFNGDGYPDLAIGVPSEDLEDKQDAGAVQVLYGTDQGLTATGNQLWHQDSPGIDGIAESSDGFGRALATGDFNGDGYMDLAVGITGEDIEGTQGAGAVQVIYGSAQGLTADGNQLWTQESPGVLGSVANADWFGAALAAGDFNGDGYADLAIGVPGEHVGSGLSGFDSGAVQVLYGTDQGLTATGNQLWHQDSPGVAGVAELHDQFGKALAAGDFNGDGYMDLAIGVPIEDVGDTVDAGVVQVLYGSADGLRATGNQMWYQGLSGLSDTAEEGDQFGSSLATGDFNGDGYWDLAVGVSREDVGSVTEAGAVQVLYGSAQGLTAAGNQLWTEADLHFGKEEPPLQEDAQFGFALAAGDFNGDGLTDLAVGVPYRDKVMIVGGVTDPGGVWIVYGSSGGLTATDSQWWDQSISGMDAMFEPEDRFGYALAVLARPPLRYKVFLPAMQKR